MLAPGHAAAAALLLLLSACSRPVDQNALDRHRNLGKAFYENPTTKEEAAGEFRQALALAPGSAREQLNYALALLKAEGHEQEAVKLLEEVQRKDPALPHTCSISGICYKRRGDPNKAIAQFEGMLARTPNEPIAHYQLGTLYRQLNRTADAQKQFQTAAALDPQLAAARFQLYNLYRLAGNTRTSQNLTWPNFSAFRHSRKPGSFPKTSSGATTPKSTIRAPPPPPSLPQPQSRH